MPNQSGFPCRWLCFPTQFQEHWCFRNSVQGDRAEVFLPPCSGCDVQKAIFAIRRSVTCQLRRQMNCQQSAAFRTKYGLVLDLGLKFRSFSLSAPPEAEELLFEMPWAAAVLIRRMRVCHSFCVVFHPVVGFVGTDGITSGTGCLGLGNWSEPRASALCVCARRMSFCLGKRGRFFTHFLLSTCRPEAFGVG